MLSSDLLPDEWWVFALDMRGRGASPASDYSANLTRKVKVLDFIKSGGPGWTRTIDFGVNSGFAENQPKSGPVRHKMPGSLPLFLEKDCG